MATYTQTFRKSTMEISVIQEGDFDQIENTTKNGSLIKFTADDFSELMERLLAMKDKYVKHNHNQTKRLI